MSFKFTTTEIRQAFDGRPGIKRYATALSEKYTALVICNTVERSQLGKALKVVLFDFRSRESGVLVGKLLSAIPDLINFRGEHGRSPIHQYGYKGSVGCIPNFVINHQCLFLKDNDGQTPLHEAATTGKINLFRCARIDEASVLVENVRGESVLKRAIQFGHFNQLPADLRRKYENQIAW